MKLDIVSSINFPLTPLYKYLIYYKQASNALEILLRLFSIESFKTLPRWHPPCT